MATLVINDDLYADVQRRAAADGTTDTAVVETALRSYLGPDGLIDRVHERNHDVSTEDVLAFAYEELDAYRADTTQASVATPRSAGGPSRHAR